MRAASAVGSMNMTCVAVSPSGSCIGRGARPAAIPASTIFFLRRAQRGERLGKLAQRYDAERALELADAVVDAEAELALRAAVVFLAVDVAVVVVAVHAEPNEPPEQPRRCIHPDACP